MSDDEITLTIPSAIVGAGRRREFKAAIRASRVLGAEVHSSEQWGLLESVMTIRAIGTETALTPLLRLLVRLGEIDWPPLKLGNHKKETR